MTKEQIKQHKESMLWFIEHPDKGVWFTQDNIDWYLTKDPLFSAYKGLIYVPNDKYSELRKARAEGKTIQILSKSIWEDLDNPYWIEALESYRIKPDEPKFKVGDWVRNTTHSNWIRCLEDDDLPDFNFETMGERFELWKPNVDEWCVFWDGNHYGYIVQQFKQEVNDFYHTNSNGVFKHTAPLEFIQTLRD